MTQAFIADASVAIGWVHPAQATSETAAMLAYATYIELAERRALALACKDGPLRKAARQRGVQLWK